MKTRSQSSNQRLHLKTIILRKKLREALALRDLESAKDILLEIYKFSNPNSNPDLIESSNTSIQVLNLAVVIGDLKLVDYIFTNNLISNHTSQEDLNEILHLAITLGHLPIVRYLIQNNLSFVTCKNILSIVIVSKELDMATYLIEKEIVRIDEPLAYVQPTNSREREIIDSLKPLPIAIKKYKELPSTNLNSQKYFNIIELLLKKGVKLTKQLIEDLYKILPEITVNAYAADAVYDKKDLKIKFDPSKISKDIFLSRLKHHFQKYGINFNSFKKHKDLFIEKYKTALPQELIKETLEYFDTLQEDIMPIESLVLSTIYGQGIAPLTKILEHWNNTKENREALKIYCETYPHYERLLKKVLDGSISKKELLILQEHIKDTSSLNSAKLIEKFLADIMERAFYTEEFRNFIKNLESKKVLPYSIKCHLTKIIKTYNEVNDFKGTKEEFITKYSKVLPKNLFENILKLFDTKTTSEKQDIVLFCQETVDYDNDVEMVPVGDQDLGE